MKKSIIKNIIFYFTSIGIYSLIMYTIPIGKNDIVNIFIKGLTTLQLIGFAFIGMAIAIKIVNKIDKDKTFIIMEETVISITESSTALIGAISMIVALICSTYKIINIISVIISK